jgi:Tfp pilus assembly protein PilV
MFHPSDPRLRPAGFTILEVLVSAVLIALAVASIMGMNTQSMRALRSSHFAAASSQVLQQRVEMMRAKPWPEIASTIALAALMAKPTDSEREMAEASLVENIEVSLPLDASDRAAPSTSSFTILRSGGTVTAGVDCDFAQYSTLVFDGTVTWRDDSGVHSRSLRTVICRDGLTRGGVFGSSLGRPGGSGPSS